MSAPANPTLERFIMWVSIGWIFVGIACLIAALFLATWGNQVYISAGPAQVMKSMFMMSGDNGGIGGILLSGPGVAALGLGALGLAAAVLGGMRAK